MSMQLCILIGYVVILLYLSWWSTRLIKKGQTGQVLGYFLGGRSMPVFIVVVLLVGQAIGGVSTVGVAERAYTQGISAGWYTIAWGLGGITVGLIVADKFRRLSVKTIPEMMGIMFGGSARSLSVFCQLLIMISITSLQYVAGGSILTTLLPDVFTFHQGMMVSAFIFIAITLIGGYWASGLTNVVNVIVIYIGVIIALYQSLNNSGGMASIITSLPPGSWFDPIDGIGLASVIAFLIVMCTMAVSNQVVSQISFAARDENTARNGFLIGGILVIPMGVLCALFGVIAASQYPGLGNPALALPTLVADLTPFVGGIFLAALWAADVSSAVGLLMSSSTLVMEDVIKRIWVRPIDQKRELLLSRIVVLFVSLAAFILSLTVVGILKTLTTALAMTTSFTLLIFAGLFAPRFLRKQTGSLVIFASLLTWGFWTLFPGYRLGTELIYLEWITCGVMFVICFLIFEDPANELKKGEI